MTQLILNNFKQEPADYMELVGVVNDCNKYI